MTKQQKHQTIWYWIVFLVIAIPMCIMDGIKSVLPMFYVWTGLYVFVVFLSWFLKKINWR
jgi:hypothetical protein